MTAKDPQWSEKDTEVFLRDGDVFVPRREEQIAIVANRIFDGGPPPRRVVELCSGEGLLTRAILERDSNVEIVALDASPGMLQATLRNAGPAAERVTARAFRLEERDWRTETAAADAVVSSLAIHHLDGPGKAALFSDIYALLSPGGVLVIADLLEPATGPGRMSYAKQWEDEVALRSLERRGDRSGLERFRALDWNYYDPREPDPMDQPSTLLEQLDWLGQSGYVRIDLLWCVAGHAIFSAEKPGD